MYPYFELTNLVMVYLLGATIAALRLGRGPASLTAVVNVLAFDFFFVPPRFTFAVSDFQYVVTFAVMLIVALVIANLVANVRAQTRVAGARERRTALLYAMSRELAATRSVDNLARVAIKHVAETFASHAVVLVPDAAGTPAPSRWCATGRAPARRRPVGCAVGLRSRPARRTGHRHASRCGARSTCRSRAAIARWACSPCNPTQRRRLLLPEQQHLLETFAGQIALAIERAQLAEEAETARVAAETESLRNTLLASISHDLRTPLAVIAGASSALNDPSLASIRASARTTGRDRSRTRPRKCRRLISNVLDLMRFEAGEVRAAT